MTTFKFDSEMKPSINLQLLFIIEYLIYRLLFCFIYSRAVNVDYLCSAVAAVSLTNVLKLPALARVIQVIHLQHKELTLRK